MLWQQIHTFRGELFCESPNKQISIYTFYTSFIHKHLHYLMFNCELERLGVMTHTVHGKMSHLNHLI